MHAWRTVRGRRRGSKRGRRGRSRPGEQGQTGAGLLGPLQKFWSGCRVYNFASQYQRPQNAGPMSAVCRVLSDSKQTTDNEKILRLMWTVHFSTRISDSVIHNLTFMILVLVVSKSFTSRARRSTKDENFVESRCEAVTLSLHGCFAEDERYGTSPRGKLLCTFEHGHEHSSSPYDQQNCPMAPHTICIALSRGPQ